VSVLLSVRMQIVRTNNWDEINNLYCILSLANFFRFERFLGKRKKILSVISMSREMNIVLLRTITFSDARKFFCQNSFPIFSLSLSSKSQNRIFNS